MKIIKVKRFGGTILGLLLFLGVFIMSSATAQAQYPYYPNQDQYRRQREEQRERQRQAQQGWYDQYGNWHSTNTQNGYYDRNGNFHPYYNQGGYYGNQGGYYGRGSYDNYPNYGGSFNFRQTALNAGYNAGISAGRNDRRSGRYNPNGHGEYRNASKDYNSREGDRGTYQQYFRMAFETGYRDGWNGY